MVDFNEIIVYEGNTVLRFEKGNPAYWGINKLNSKQIKSGDKVVMHKLIVSLIVSIKEMMETIRHPQNKINEDDITDVKHSLGKYLKMVDESILNTWLRNLFKEDQSHPYLNRYIGPSFMRHSMLKTNMESVLENDIVDFALINDYVCDVLCTEEMIYLFKEDILKKDQVFEKISLNYVKENMSSLLEQYFFLTKTLPFIELFELNHPESIKEWEDYLQYVKENTFDDVISALKNGSFHSLQRANCEKEFFDILGINDDKKREKLESELVNFIKSPKYNNCLNYAVKLWWGIVSERENNSVKGTFFENVVDIVYSENNNDYECILNLEKLAKVNDIAKDYFFTLGLNEDKSFIQGRDLAKFFENENIDVEFNIDFSGGQHIPHLKENLVILNENNPKYINEKQVNIRKMLKEEYQNQLEKVYQEMTFPMEKLSDLFKEVGLSPFNIRFKYVFFDNSKVYSAIIKKDNQYEAELLKDCLKQMLYSNQTVFLEKIWKIQIDEFLMKKELAERPQVLQIKKTHKF